MEAECHVLCQYCGGCGFQSKADLFVEELQERWDEEAEVERELKVGLLADVGTTGAFEVRVKRCEEGEVVWRTVHSKIKDPSGKAGGGHF